MYTLEEITNDELLSAVNQEEKEALQSFKDLQTFKAANRAQRLPGLQKLVDELTLIHCIPAEIKIRHGESATDAPVYVNDAGLPVHHINLDKLSIISLLCAYSRLRQNLIIGSDDFLPRQRWAINLFRSVYPDQFAGLTFHPEFGGFSKPGEQLGFKARIQGITASTNVTEVLDADVYNEPYDTVPQAAEEPLGFEPELDEGDDVFDELDPDSPER
jgi:hypothetical protein